MECHHGSSVVEKTKTYVKCENADVKCHLAKGLGGCCFFSSNLREMSSMPGRCVCVLSLQPRTVSCQDSMVEIAPLGTFKS